MYAALARSDGDPHSLRAVELPPVPIRAGAVRVRVDAMALNPADLKVLKGGFVGGLLHARTDPLVVGYDFVGRVIECGEDADLSEGDRVYGHLAYGKDNDQGSLAEEVVVDAGTVAIAPGRPDAEVAALPTVTLTALQALRDHAGLTAGDDALVIGASGGVGTAAVGIARRLGARVTAVCGPYAVEAVTALGADTVIDRSREDFRARAERFDTILDASGKYGFGALRSLLRRGGHAVTTLPSPTFALARVLAPLAGLHAGWVMVDSNRADLDVVRAWVADGLRVPVAEQFPWDDAENALTALARGGVVGKIVVTRSVSTPRVD